MVLIYIVSCLRKDVFMKKEAISYICFQKNGIGRAIALHLLEAGYSVVIAEIDPCPGGQPGA